MRQRSWYLEGFEGSDSNRPDIRTPVRTTPFSVGRRPSCDLTLGSKMVSQHHAEIVGREGALYLRDLESTNGTFINGKQLKGEQRIETGDILHFADLEFRLVEDEVEPSWMPATRTVEIKDAMAPGGVVARYRELREMLQEGHIRTMFQPIVKLSDRTLLGHEVLGRGILAGQETSPGELFMTAESIGLAEELSVAFRVKGMQEAKALPAEQAIFLNTHPAELQAEHELIASIRALRDADPERSLVLEIHEGAVASVAALQGLRDELDRLSIRVAFDDFGTGQARLAELTDAAPDYLKFDIAFIRNIHQAKPQRREMVRTLVKLVVDMGITTLAEGIECEEEAQACLEMGFEYAQGYHLGHPAPVETFL